MAYYKDARVIEHENSSIFDDKYNPGANTPYSGIYRCVACGIEVTSEEDQPLPPSRHHEHSGKSIQWQLAVKAKHK